MPKIDSSQTASFLAIAVKRLGGTMIIEPGNEEEDAIIEGGELVAYVDDNDNYVLRFFPKHMIGNA